MMELLHQSSSDRAAIHRRPAELLQNLIRFNTTNPPGNEAECINYIDSLLTATGFKTSILARDPARPNLVTRLPGEGKAPPLLLYGHVDVVTTERETWQHPPFEGRIVDGCVWGRGAFDDKGGVAMLLAACLRAKIEGLTPPGDVVLAIVSDEESGGYYGAKYLVEDHASLFEGVRYAIGESGAFPFYLERRKFYPIMVAEKQSCSIKATVRGPSGHAMVSIRGGAAAKLARLLQRLDRRRLPVHINPVVRQMLTTASSAVPFPTSFVLRLLLRPALTDRLLDLLGARGKTIDAMLHNTVAASIIRGGEWGGTTPSEITVELTAFMLPGYTPDDLIAELHRIVGDDVELELLYTVFVEPSTPAPDMRLFDTLARILREADPAGIPVPFLMPGPSDGRIFSRLGIQTYGFMPMNWPAGPDFSSLSHNANERIPVDALNFGTDAIHKLLQRFSGS